MSDETKDEGWPRIWTAIARAQSRMRQPPRDREVTVTTTKGAKYTYSYATLTACLRSCAPLAEEGIALVWGLDDSDKQRAVTLRLVASDGSSTDPVRVPVLVQGNGAQDLGSALTYARRYALTLVVGLAADDDDDGSEADQRDVHAIAERPAPRPQESRQAPASVPEPRGPRDWWDGWRIACEAIGLAFPDALAITRGAGVDTDDEGAVRAAWPAIEAKVRKLSRTQQPSRSRDGKGYELTRTAERWRCNCEAGSFGRPCVHAAAAEVGWWRGLMAPVAWSTIAAVCGDRPEDAKLDEALGLVRSWRDMMSEVGE